MDRIKSPLISIITVSFNTLTTIEQTILSVINQNFNDYEYIVIDGGSNDGTVETIKKYQDKISYWISEPDKGIYDAMNKGILAANGEYIYFLNVGDYFFSDQTLSQIVTQFSLKDDVIYGNTCIVDKKNNTSILKPTPIEIDWKTMPYCHQSVLIKKKLLQANLFNLKYKIAADYNQYFDLKKAGANFKYLNLTVSRYDNHGISAQQHGKLLKESQNISLSNAFFITRKIQVFYFFQKCKIVHLLSTLVRKNL